MNLFDLEAVLTLNSLAYERGLAAAEHSANTAGSSIGNFIKTGLKVATVALTGAGTAAVAFGKSAINAASTFETAFTGVRKTVDATEEEFTQLSDWIMEASTKMALSKEGIAGTMEIAGQLGIRGVESLEAFTETMVMLGDTTNLNAEEAAGALARFMNITGDAATDVSKIGSVIVDLGNNFATTEADIVSMATRLASAGTIAGLSSTDILALSTAMSSVGIQAEAGGTAMTQTLVAISKAVSGIDDVTSDAYKDLEMFADVSGMSAEAFAKQWKDDPVVALQAFIKGLDNVNKSGKNVFSTLGQLGLSGIRQTNMLQSLALASGMLGSAVQTANVAFEENNALMAEAEKRYGTTESQAMQTAESMKNLKVIMGKELLPVYSELMSFSQAAMQSLSTGLKEGGMKGFMESLGTAVSDGLNMLFEKIPDFLDAGAKLLGALGKGLISNISGIAKTALEIGERLLVGITKAIPQVIKGGIQLATMLIKGIAEKLPELIPVVVDGILDVAKALTEPQTITSFVQAAFELINALYMGIIQAIPKILETIPEIITNVINAIMQSVPIMVNAWVSVFTAFVDNLPAIISAITAVIPEIIVGIVTAVTQNLPAIVEAGFKLFVALISALPEIIVAVVKAIPQIIVAFIDAFKEHWPDMKQAGIDLFNSFMDGLKSLFSNIADVVAEIWDLIKTNFSIVMEQAAVIFEPLVNAWDETKNKFISTTDNIKRNWQETSEKLMETWNSFYNIFRPAIEAFKYLIETIFQAIYIISSRVWNAIKEYILEQWNKIVTFTEEKLNKIKEFVTNVFTAVKNFVKDVWEKIYGHIEQPTERAYSKVQEIYNAMHDFVKRIVNSMKNAVSDAMDAIGNIIGNVVDRAWTWGKDLLQNFIDGIRSRIQNLADTIEEIADKIKALIGFSEPKEGPLSNFHTYAPDMMNLFIEGIKNNQSALQDAVARAFDFQNLIKAPVVESANASVNGDAMRSGKGNSYYTINVNQPVSTPADMLREIRTEAQYGLILEEAIG